MELNVKIVLAIWNVFVCLLYGLDKSRAVRGERRISEKELITLAFLFGGAGAMFGMILFNHKTSKMKFRILVPLAVVINAVIIASAGGLIYV